VARRTALEARRAGLRRREKEAGVAPRAGPTGDAGGELGPVLDEELARLPERYRTVLVLCSLEGRGRKEVARELGWPEGTVASRLARARQLLAGRLARRGLAPAALAVALPQALVTSTGKAAAGAAVGRAAVAGAVSARAAALTEGVLRAMFLSKLKTAAALALALAVGTGTAGLAYRGAGGAGRAHAGAGGPGRLAAPAPPVVPDKGKEEDKERIEKLEKTVRELEDRLRRADQARVRAHVAAQRDRAKLQDELARMAVARATLEKELRRRDEEIDCVLKTVDVKGRTVSVVLLQKLAVEAVPVSAKAEVRVEGRAAALADLRAGMAASLRLGDEGGRGVVVRIRVAPPRKE
jgi:hypothetical protein